MQIRVNGKDMSIEDNWTLLDFLNSLRLQEERIAVERNQEIVHRENWSMIHLSNGDELEIVRFVGGG